MVRLSTKSCFLIVLVVLVVPIGAYILYQYRAGLPLLPPASIEQVADKEAEHQHSNQPESSTSETVSSVIEFPRTQWEPANLTIESVKKAPLSENITLTGKITLNEDKLAHVFPLVEGRVRKVQVGFGQRVTKGDLLVTIQSKEVGERMLQLFQDRLRLSFAKIKNQWAQDVGENTLSLIEMMRRDASIEEIESAFKERTMGEYRERLMTPYVAYLKAKIHISRLMPLSKDGAISGRQLIDAESERDATRAVLVSLLEQVSQDVKQAIQLSAQAVEETQTSAAVAEANLRILEFSDAALKEIDPSSQGDSLAHYPITAPFDGTVISKDVVLMERVGPERQILTIADLSSVWVTADIYESHLPLLAKLRDKPVKVHCDAWPGRTFEAQIFYTGDVVQEGTRTIALRALAPNDEGLLKPGMFANVTLPDVNTEDVLQIPYSAIQDHEGKSFVFIQTGEEEFERRDVTIGRRNQDIVEIRAGLNINDRVVSNGGFALKSKMLAGLLAD
ncbi:efflux RND transporter periplasmic adaptor subunit [Planctomicrobium sp. SH527]|uniref:efflux RND transporter periplasmic adaptor subunit n=1 Tax=Planctomicrobium sp. SH527 TaxID=3448123 RepID=UPI003F5B62F8